FRGEGVSVPGAIAERKSLTPLGVSYRARTGRYNACEVRMKQKSESPATSASSKIEYVLGTSDRERQRLIRQAAWLRDQTLDAFRWGGITSGMRVLDIGCGAGDVAMLAADLVGPSGCVITIDRDVDNLVFAKQRATTAGYTNIDFRAAEID